MSEGRRTQVVLLDDRRLDIIVQPKLHVSELLNIVASHCQLKDADKQYFGLAYYDESQQCHWLQNDRRVLDHDYPRKFVVSGVTLILFHLPKFFIESITQFTHASCVELMFLHVRAQLAKGLIEADNNTVCQLGAYVMQACFGDFTDMTSARSQMKRSHLFPPRLMKDAFFMSQCEDRVLEFYQNQHGVSKGMAVVNYMTAMERLQTYGIQIFEVQDKAGVSLTLGISNRGIFQYELNNIEKARRVFYWKQLENLYYRDRKFSIEVNDVGRVTHTLSSFNVYEDAIQEPEDECDELTEAICDPSTQVSVSRRAFLPSGVYVHVFWCESAQLCKTIWSLAIAQHQFYLDKRAASKKASQILHHSVTELADKLDKLIEDGSSSIGKISNELNGATSGLTPSISSTSLRSFPSERSEEEKQKDVELYKRLKSRKQELEQLLIERTKELKDVCIREGEISGELPPEIRRALAPGESEPKIKRRVGTSFTITSETMIKHRKADQITKLEADVDIHRKIVAAALKLANDSTTNKSVRRKRRRDYESALQRLRQLEQRLHQLRISSSKPDLPNAHLEGALLKLAENGHNFRVSKSLPGTPHGSTPDLSTANSSLASDFGQKMSKQLSPFIPGRRPSAFSNRPPNLPIAPSSPRRRQPDQNTLSVSHRGLQHSSSFPNEEPSLSPLGIKPMDRSPSIEHSNGGFLAKPPNGSNGYRSQATYQSSYRSQNYPTLSNSNNNNIGFVKPISISDSNHSLHGGSTTSGSESLTTVAIDHSVGAYNIPNQRTSWDYECLSAMNSGVVAALLQGSSESLNIGNVHSSSTDVGPMKKYSADGGCNGMNGRIRPKGPMIGFSSDFHTGSLDRRLLNQRQRENWRPTPSRMVDKNANDCSPNRTMTPEINVTPTTSLPPSVMRYPSTISQQSTIAQSISPRFVHKLLSTSPSTVSNSRFTNGQSSYLSNGGSGVETVKPYETSDLIKYGGTIRQISSFTHPNNRFLAATDQNSTIRKYSPPSSTSSASSPPPSSGSSCRNFGSPKRVENWWTSQVANNNSRRNYPNLFHNQKLNGRSDLKMANGSSNGSMTIGEEGLSWYEDQDPSRPSKLPTIV